MTTTKPFQQSMLRSWARAFSGSQGLPFRFRLANMKMTKKQKLTEAEEKLVDQFAERFAEILIMQIEHEELIKQQDKNVKYWQGLISVELSTGNPL